MRKLAVAIDLDSRLKLPPDSQFQFKEITCSVFRKGAPSPANKVLIPVRAEGFAINLSVDGLAPSQFSQLVVLESGFDFSAM